MNIKDYIAAFSALSITNKRNTSRLPVLINKEYTSVDDESTTQ